MHIGLDYDDTYTRDPLLWECFITAALHAGHKVSIVTFRDDRFDMTPMLKALTDRVPVYCTRGVAKAFFMDNFATHVDVWIDDRPAGILANSTMTPEALAEWRAANAAAAVELERPAA